MLYDAHFERAMEMLNRHIQEMKKELLEVQAMPLKRKEQEMVKSMESIYRQIEKMIKKFLKTQSEHDFRSVCRILEALQPAFVLNYSEVCYEQDLAFLNQNLEEMALEIKKLEQVGLTKDLTIMKKIYHELLLETDQYAHSHDRTDFKKAIKTIEQEKREFILNYKKLKP